MRVLKGYTGNVFYGVHNASLVNLVRGVVERVLFTANSLGELEKPRQALKHVFRRLEFEKLALIRCTLPTRVVSLEEFPSLYNDSRRRTIYERAVTSLFSKAITKSDSFVSTFVKAEKINFSAKPDPAPRVIQPRTARYNACLGCYLKPLEKVLLASHIRSHGYRVVAKGLNATGVAELLWDNWQCYKQPVAIGLDASRFDQHVGVEALKFEHSVYNSIFGHDPFLKKLLNWQLVNKGYGYSEGMKVKYTVEGCRMSGDMNTSMGNCIIMSSIVLGYLREHGIDARLTNNGDDCVVIMELAHLHQLDGIDAWFTEFGFKLTREQAVTVFERIEFCQTQPVHCSDGWRMVRNPYTASSKDTVSLLSWDTEYDFDSWRGAISSCGLSLTTGVPFWEAYYRQLGGKTTETASAAICNSGLGYLARGMDSCATITPETRFSFWKAFNMLPDAQIELENMSVSIRYKKSNPLIFGHIEPLHSLLQNFNND